MTSGSREVVAGPVNEGARCPLSSPPVGSNRALTSNDGLDTTTTSWSWCRSGVPDVGIVPRVVSTASASTAVHPTTVRVTPNLQVRGGIRSLSGPIRSRVAEPASCDKNLCLWSITSVTRSTHDQDHDPLQIRDRIGPFRRSGLQLVLVPGVARELQPVFVPRTMSKGIQVANQDRQSGSLRSTRA